MITVERGNTVLDIDDSEAKRYLALGYNITDGKGNIIEECVPTDNSALRKAFIEHKEKIKELEEKIKELEANNKETAKKATKKTAE
jgi:hypothetical protein